MNLKEAKVEIKRSVETYLDKDEQGEYVIPYMRQRPILMMGPPGIGKTAAVEQIAEELDVALVMYSMTQHTRQSIMGRPLIKKKQYCGKVYEVTEYTLSEMLSEIYRVMERSGKKEGILFIDEICCVSEVLAPVVFRLFRYKRLGNGTLPEGWVIVAADCPAQYRHPVHAFDIAALDRMRCLEVGADFLIWKQYAYRHGIHAAILTFLQIHRVWFYSVDGENEKKSYVTARGWEDLSRAIQAYERKAFSVDRNLILQYVANPEAARIFASHYKWFLRIRGEYPINRILEGQASDEVIMQAQKAVANEKLVLLGILIEQVNMRVNHAVRQDIVLQQISEIVEAARKEIRQNEITPHIILKCECIRVQTELKQKQAAHSISAEAKADRQSVIRILCEYVEMTEGDTSAKEQLTAVRKKQNRRVKKQENEWKACEQVLGNVISFVKNMWETEKGLELLIEELTMNELAVAFLARCDSGQLFG